MFNAINWFDIPAVNFERAVRFYETILQVTLHQEALGGTMNGIFPADQAGVNGAVCSGEGYTPSAAGSIVYLNANGRIDDILSRVEAAGGQIIRPKRPIGPFGYIAWLIDSEGNRIGLHAEPTE
ncbi:MAG TPA: VOC family protein [Phototrophicaceae bacterium]|nr:VOC family protein [Phototrophicaceae bacterium]